MGTGAGFGQKKLVLALLVALILAALIAASGRPAQALPCDPNDPGCTGGGGTTIHVINTLKVTSPSHGRVTSSDSGIDCGLGNTDCTQTYNYTIFCDSNGDCTTPDYDTVDLTASPEAGYAFADWAGNCGGNGSCSVTMDADRTVGAQFNDAVDPTVNLTRPADGARVGSSFEAAATATDNVGVAGVSFYVDGVQVAVDTSAPYAATINTTSYTSGTTHMVSARARDVNGRISSASSSNVLVDLTSPTATGSPTGTRVSPTANVVAIFSEAMDEASVEATNSTGLPTAFTLKKQGTTKKVAATVVYKEPTSTTFKAVLNPSASLRAGTTYVATLNSSATDLVGNPLVRKSWTFTVRP